MTTERNVKININLDYSQEFVTGYALVLGWKPTQTIEHELEKEGDDPVAEEVENKQSASEFIEIKLRNKLSDDFSSAMASYLKSESAVKLKVKQGKMDEMIRAGLAIQVSN